MATLERELSAEDIHLLEKSVGSAHESGDVRIRDEHEELISILYVTGRISEMEREKLIMLLDAGRSWSD